MLVLGDAGWVPVVVMPLVILLAVVTVAFHITASTRMLEAWAARNGYELLRRERCWFWRGPFAFSSSKHQSVFRVAVRDQTGNVFTGYVKCGGFFLGMLSDQVVERWDQA